MHFHGVFFHFLPKIVIFEYKIQQKIIFFSPFSFNSPLSRLSKLQPTRS